MDTDTRLHEAITRGLVFLGQLQRKDGGFSSLSSADGRLFASAQTHRTNFVPALILGCLSGIDSANSKTVRDGLAQFLLRQRSANWTFNYWSRGAVERTTHPYPDDLDDTFCALSSL